VKRQVIDKKKAKEAAAAAAVLKAAADAAAEVERKHAEVLAAAAKEEARIATERRAEEQERLQKSATRMNISGTDEKMKDIFVWLHSIPFSRRLVKIERDFSDGCLIAEIVSHYCPKLCDKNQYFPWLSSVNKISNWMLLNYKVFPKLGFQLNDGQIKSLVHPFSCGKFEKNCDKQFIYTLLKSIQEVLAKLNPKVFDYKKKSYVPPKRTTKHKKFTMYRKRKSDKSMPTFSKVEMLLEAGFYDRDKKPENEGNERNEAAAMSSFTDMGKRYTTVEDETTIYMAPSYSFQSCMRPNTSSDTSYSMRPDTAFSMRPDTAYSMRTDTAYSMRPDTASSMRPNTCYSCFYL